MASGDAENSEASVAGAQDGERSVGSPVFKINQFPTKKALKQVEDLDLSIKSNGIISVVCFFLYFL